MDLSVSNKRSNKSHSIVSTVELGDLFAILFMVLAMFSYGSVWTKLTGGQITAFRLTTLMISLILTLWKSKEIKFTLPLIFALIYSGIVVIQAAMTPPGQGGNIMQGLLIFLVFLVPLNFARRYGIHTLISLIFGIFFIAFILMAGFAVISGGVGFLVKENDYIFSSNYILGNKFVLSYTGLLTLSLFFYKYKSIVKTMTMGIFIGLICFYVDCSTGVIGAVIMMLFILIPRVYKSGVGGMWMIPCIIVVMALIAVAGTWILKLPAIQSLTVGILGESSDFTGRLPIYNKILDWFLIKPIFGFGSTSLVNLTVAVNTGAADCQEGLFQILLTNGLIGGLIFLGLCVVSLRSSLSSDLRFRGIYSYLIAMACASLVEINLGSFFLLGLSLMSLGSSKALIFEKDG